MLILLFDSRGLRPPQPPGSYAYGRHWRLDSPTLPRRTGPRGGSWRLE